MLFQYFLRNPVCYGAAVERNWVPVPAGKELSNAVQNYNENGEVLERAFRMSKFNRLR